MRHQYDQGHRIAYADELVIAEWSKVKNWAYVVLSRVLTLAGLFLTEPIPDNIDFRPAPDYLEMMEQSLGNNFGRFHQHGRMVFGKPMLATNMNTESTRDINCNENPLSNWSLQNGPKSNIGHMLYFPDSGT